MKTFDQEVITRIAANADNAQLRADAEAFMKSSLGPQYSYNFSWLGRPIIQYPQDIVAMQELVWRIQPELIIEMGIAHGGSLILYASLLELNADEPKQLWKTKALRTQLNAAVLLEDERMERSVEKGTAWVGHSDVTALQLAALAHDAAGPHKVEEGVTAGFWAGPMACDDFGRDDSPEGGDDVTQDCFVEAMTGELEAIGFRTEAGFDGLDVSGRLWGGNLAMVQALLGTPHFPKIKNGVLFLEDVNEHPYRIERALLQLHQAGVLDKQKAVVLGAFTEFKPSPLDHGYKLKTAIDFLRTQTSTPILTGLPFGHVPVKLCLPLGRKVELVVQGRDTMMFW